MPTEPLVVRIMREFKEALLAEEQEQLLEMARRWLTIERALSGDMLSLAMHIDELRVAGETVSASRLFQLSRYRSLLAQTRVEVLRYADYAEGLIAGKQAEWGALAISNATDAINAAFISAGTVPARFDILPVEAIQSMVGLAGDGSPLSQLLRDSYADAAEGITNALLRAITIGQNPRVTAAEMAEGMSVSLNRMMVTARTEQLRVYRDASRRQMASSGVVEGYRRLCAHDDRVCPACLMAEGRVYPLDEPLDEHPQGRCAQVPIVKDLPRVEWLAGEDWFTTQDEETQRTILGDKYFDAWQGGQFELSAIVSRREDDRWGASLHPTPLSELVG